MINLCGSQNIKTSTDIPHTFVVVGTIRNENIDPTLNSPANINHNNKLWAGDAWPILGGAVKLKDFWLRTSASVLKVDCTIIADGKDHLIKRVLKQKELMKKTDVKFENTGHSSLHHDLPTQSKLGELVKPMSLKGYETAEGMWNETAVASDYKEHPDTAAVMYNIINQFPALKELLTSLDSELEGIPYRKGSGFP